MGQVEAQEVEPVKAPGRFPVMSEEWTKTRRDDRLGFERVLDLVGVGWVGALGPGHLHVVTLWGLRVLIRGGEWTGHPLGFATDRTLWSSSSVLATPDAGKLKELIPSPCLVVGV
jgi:hypothetical protein